MRDPKRLWLGGALGAVVMAVAAWLSFAADLRVLGIVFLVLMLGGALTSVVGSIRFRNRALADLAEARRQQAVQARAKPSARTPRRY